MLGKESLLTEFYIMLLILLMRAENYIEFIKAYFNLRLKINKIYETIYFNSEKISKLTFESKDLFFIQYRCVNFRN